MHGYVLLQAKERYRSCSAVISLPLLGTHTLCPWVLQMTFFCGKLPGVAPVFLFSNTKARLARSRSGSKKLDHRCCLTRIGRQNRALFYLDCGEVSRRDTVPRQQAFSSITERARLLLSSARLGRGVVRRGSERLQH